MEFNQFDVHSYPDPENENSGAYDIVLLKSDRNHVRITTFYGVWGREDAYRIVKELNRNEERLAFEKRFEE